MTTQYITLDKLRNDFPQLAGNLEYYCDLGAQGLVEDINEFWNSGGKRGIIKKHLIDRHDRQWEDGFMRQMRSQFKSFEIRSTTLGLAPNYSGVITLEMSEHIKTELHFNKSIVADYFTIEIIESTIEPVVLMGNLSGKHIEPKLIIVSPTGTYEPIFKKVYAFIKNYYPNAVFLPYHFDLFEIKDYRPFNDSETFPTVHQCLFRKFSSFNNEIKIIGNDTYKIEKVK